MYDPLQRLQTRQAARWWYQADADQVGVRKVLDADPTKAQQVKKTSPKAGKGGRSHLETTAI